MPSSHPMHSSTQTSSYPRALSHLGANGGESVTNSASPMGASVSFAYANAPTTSNPTANFEPSSSTDTQSNATAYTYNGAGNLASAKNALAAVASVAYNSDGTVKSSTDPKNGTNSTTYAYNSDHQLTSITPPTGNELAIHTFSYDADGRRTATFFNTVTGNTTWAARTLTTYDKSGRITRITTALNSSPGDLVLDTSYCYSPFVSGQSCPTASASTDTGLLQYSTNNMTGTVSVYSYDNGNRLTKATNVAGHTFAYTYDSDGNRTSVKIDGTTTQSLTYNSANQISSSGYAYDGAGNMTAVPGGTSYSYNAAEQMSSSTVSGTTSGHVYAGTGERELTSAGSNQFVWGRNDHYGQPWLQSFNTGGQSQVYAEHDGFGTPLGLHNAGNDFYLVLDNLGSVVAVVNTAGTVVARYSYDPYGNLASVDESGLSQPNIVRYTGGAFDQATGLTKLGQRYYDPVIGAFTQPDASQLLASPQNGNLYAYAGDSPATYTDPTGMWSWPSFLFAAVVGYFTGTICWAVSAAAAPETAGGSLGLAAVCAVVPGAIIGGIAGR